jgi:CheY-like chemotaxis protein
MSEEHLVKIIEVLPSAMWVAFAAYVFYSLRGALLPMMDRIANFEAFGLKLSLSGGDALSAAVELAQKLVQPAPEIPLADRRRALDRAQRERKLLDGAEILWVDDVPSNNRNEARMLRSFGVLITFACTTDEAVRAINYAVEQAQPFNLIISDISRESPTADPLGGIHMLARLRDAKASPPVVFYVSRLEPDGRIPQGAFGITNRPDHLLQLVIDALARSRG